MKQYVIFQYTCKFLRSYFFIFQMAFKPQPSPNKVNFFKHFPHYFLRPYDAQIHYNEQDFIQNLNAKNCEWTTRPKIAMSEAAEALLVNWEIFKDSELIDDTTRTYFRNILTPVTQNLANLDSKDKSSNPTPEDVYEVMHWCFANPDLDVSLSHWMQESAALFVFIAQLRAMRGLITNPEQYSAKLVNDSPEAVEFKTAKNVTTMQRMLTSMCIPTAPPSASSCRNVRALATQLANPSAPASTVSGPPAAHHRASTVSGLEPPAAYRTASTGLQQPPPLSAFPNELTDMILQLQSQIQAMQQQTSAQPTTSAQQDQSTKKSKKRKRTPMPVLEETASLTCAQEEQPDRHQTTSTKSKKNRRNRASVEVVEEETEAIDEPQPTKKSKKEKSKK